MAKWTRKDIALWQLEREHLEKVVEDIERAIVIWIAIGTLFLIIAVMRL